jgi:hypothetical protein
MTDLVPYIPQRPPTGRYVADWLLDPAELAQRIGGTDFVPTALRNNPAAITAALLYGEEVGLAGPMTSLARIAVINGKPTLAAEAQRALILHAGHDLWIDELTVSRCTVAGRRRDSDQISRVTWTMDDARRAGLAGKQPWRTYPRQMLLARASAELARAVFPDAIGGLAATEELEDSPELADANGATEPKPTRRRRRANVSTTETAQPPAPTHSPEEAPASEPAGSRQVADKSTELSATTAEGDIDDLAREFDATLVEAEPAPITDAQRRKIHALFREQNVSDRDERLTICAGIVGHEVATSTSLTLDEASQIIEWLSEHSESQFQAPAGALDE